MTQEKICTTCNRSLDIEQFGKQKSSPTGLRYECKECQRAYMSAWRSKNRQRMRDQENRRRSNMSEEEKARKRRLDSDRYHRAPDVARDKLMRRKYGIGQLEYDHMLADQGGVCAICADPPGERILHVDHHHATGAVRGLLCTRCNIGLGQFRDDPGFLSQAISYLVNN